MKIAKQMLALSLGIGFALGLLACKSNPHKAEKIETKLRNESQVTGDEKVGVKDGNMIVQKKLQK